MIVETCRARARPQAPRGSPPFTSALGSGTPAVSSGGQVVASIEFVGHYPAGRVAFNIAKLPELLQR